MAWRCSGATNGELIDNLYGAKIIKDRRIVDAMKATDRKYYVRPGYDPYEDAPQPIGFDATISAPHMHAHALDYLLPYLKPGAKVLDVGCGSGYLVGILHELVQPGGKVVGIDHIKGLTKLSDANLRADKHGITLDSGAVKIVTGDGRKGWPAEAPYDVIHVGAASPEMPQTLIDQLKAPGRMFVPVGTHSQEVYCVDKDEAGQVKAERLFGVRYDEL